MGGRNGVCGIYGSRQWHAAEGSDEFYVMVNMMIFSKLSSGSNAVEAE